MNAAPALSVVVPLFNEEENVAPLILALRRALPDADGWEALLVDDGSSDRTAALVEERVGNDPRFRLLRLARNYGQTPAMQAGFDHARGSVVVSMDGDLQNDPRDIPRLVEKLEEGYDLVAGYREGRQDRFLTRKVPSWIANRLIHWTTGVPIRDNGCSLKAYRKPLLDRLHLYSDLHRFLPALAAGTAGARIAEIPVRHHPRRHGTSKYGLSRVGKVLADLLTIKMIRSFREQPLAMFAVGAVLAGLVGGVFLAGGLAAYLMFGPEKANAVVLPGSALVWFGFAVYLIMLGLIAEVALREQRARTAVTLPLAREAARG